MLVQVLQEANTKMKYCARRNLLEEMSVRENSKGPEEGRRSIGLKFMSDPE